MLNWGNRKYTSRDISGFSGIQPPTLKSFFHHRHLCPFRPSNTPLYSHQRKVSHFCYKSVLSALQRIVFSIILLYFSRAECTTHCIEVFYGVSIQGFERSVSTGGIGVPRRIRQFSRNLHSQFSLEFLYKVGIYARYQTLSQTLLTFCSFELKRFNCVSMNIRVFTCPFVLRSSWENLRTLGSTRQPQTSIKVFWVAIINFGKF